MAIAVEVSIVPGNIEEMIQGLVEILEDVQALQKRAGVTDSALQGHREKIERLLEQMEDALDMQEARAAFEDAELHGVVPWEEVKLGLDL